MKYTIGTLTLATILLTACGGGGGGGESTAPGNGAAPVANPTPTATPTPTPTPEYAPDSGLLAVAAENSGDLYVEESFTFIATRTLALSVNLNNSSQSTQRVAVYAVENAADQETAHSLQDASLITMGITDANGFWHTELEVPAHYNQLLFKTAAMGLENFQFVSLTGGDLEYVHLVFEN